MKSNSPSRQSIDLRSTKLLRDEPSTDNPDSVEDAFEQATLGFPGSDVEILRELSVVAALAQSTGHFQQLCCELKGLEAAKALHRVLIHLGEDGRARLNCEGVDAHDFMCSVLQVLYGVNAWEVDELAAACVQYGKVAARPRIAMALLTLRRSSAGEALRQALGVAPDSLRDAAKRLGVSAATLSKSSSRIAARFHHKG